MTKQYNFAGYMQIVEETNRDRCRICKHSRYDHATCPRKGKKCCLYFKDLTSPYPTMNCKCENFVTNDNLEYLEMIYNERTKLGKNTSRKSSKNKQAK